MKTKNSIIALIVIVTLGACSKSDTGAPAKTKKTLLTQAIWKGVTIEEATSATGPFTMRTIRPCRLDDYAQFRTDGTLEANEGATKCNPTDPQSTMGTWLFQNNETGLKISSQLGVLADYVIITLNENSLVVIEDQTVYNTTPLFVRTTFTH